LYSAFLAPAIAAQPQKSKAVTARTRAKPNGEITRPSQRNFSIPEIAVSRCSGDKSGFWRTLIC
jgi:hypothetical protein